MLCQFGFTALRLLPVARRVGIPIVVHFHGVDISSSLRNRWYLSSLRRSLPSFDSLVVVGRYQREWLLAEGVPPEKVSLIPCGVPVGDFSGGDRAPGATCRFLAVGRLVPKKAPLEVVRAFAHCRRTVPEVRLAMVGQGPSRPPAGTWPGSSRWPIRWTSCSPSRTTGSGS